MLKLSKLWKIFSYIIQLTIIQKRNYPAIPLVSPLNEEKEWLFLKSEFLLIRTQWENIQPKNFKGCITEPRDILSYKKCIIIILYEVLKVKLLNIVGGFADDSDGKESACNTGDPGSIPASGRSPGEGNGNPLPYSCLENPMDRGACWVTVHGVAKSWTQLSD